MEHGFYHPSRGYWQTNSEPPQHVLDGYPEGTVEVSLKPGANYEWDGSEWTYVAPPNPTIEQLRAAASLPKDDFILAALDAGVLSEYDAEEATNGWPTGWNAFFTGQPARDRIEAKARWASAATIARTAPLIEALAAFKGLSPDQVDSMFGINS